MWPRTVKLLVHTMTTTTTTHRAPESDIRLDTLLDFPDVDDGDLLELYHGDDPVNTHCLIQSVSPANAA